MKLSSIKYPTDDRFVQVRDAAMILCDGNAVAAALISFFDYNHTWRLERKKDAEKANKVQKGKFSTSLLQSYTIDELTKGIKGIGKKGAILTARTLLIKKGIISEHKNPNPQYKFDRKIFFLFHPKKINKFITEFYNKITDEQRDSLIDACYSQNAKNRLKKLKVAISQSLMSPKEGILPPKEEILPPKEEILPTINIDGIIDGKIEEKKGEPFSNFPNFANDSTNVAAQGENIGKKAKDISVLPPNSQNHQNRGDLSDLKEESDKIHEETDKSLSEAFKTSNKANSDDVIIAERVKSYLDVRIGLKNELKDLVKTDEKGLNEIINRFAVAQALRNGMNETDDRLHLLLKGYIYNVPETQKSDSSNETGIVLSELTQEKVNELKIEGQENRNKAIQLAYDLNTMMIKLKPNLHSYKAATLKTWLIPILQMFKNNKATEAQIYHLFKFATKHDFWQNVILTPQNLAKNFDKVMIAYENRNKR